jgi:hypothetical protein
MSLFHRPVRGISATDSGSELRNGVELLNQLPNLYQRGITSGHDAFDAGGTDNIGMVGKYVWFWLHVVSINENTRRFKGGCMC